MKSDIARLFIDWEEMSRVCHDHYRQEYSQPPPSSNQYRVECLAMAILVPGDWWQQNTTYVKC